MATGTSGDKRDDDLTDASSADVDAETTDEAEAVSSDAANTDAADADTDVTESESAADSSEAAGAAGAAASKTVVKDKREKQGKTLKRSEAEAANKKVAKENRLAKFFGEVMAEIKKVVTPTRKEFWRYVAVVLGFLVIVMALVALFDFVFNFLASWTFGSGQQLFSLPLDPTIDALPAA